jgi:hypothetical protein
MVTASRWRYVSRLPTRLRGTTPRAGCPPIQTRAASKPSARPQNASGQLQCLDARHLRTCAPLPRIPPGMGSAGSANSPKASPRPQWPSLAINTPARSKWPRKATDHPGCTACNGQSLLPANPIPEIEVLVVSSVGYRAPCCLRRRNRLSLYPHLSRILGHLSWELP